MEIIKRLGPIDLVFIIIFLRITYTALSKGFVSELIKTMGLLIGALIALQFYPALANYIADKVTFLSQEYFNCIAFLAIYMVSSIIFSLISKIVRAFYKRQEIPLAEKIISMLVGWIRCAFLFSIIMFFLYLAPLSSMFYANSFSYDWFKNFAPKTYLATVNVIREFNDNVSLNEEVKNYHETREDLS